MGKHAAASVVRGDQRPLTITQNLSFEKLSASAFVLVLAGSETSATTLSGATFLLLTHPHVLARLQHEVRTSFGSEAEITLVSVNRLSYLLAVINETLRLYPPTPSGLVRKVPGEGQSIAGHYVPRGVSVPPTLLSCGHHAPNEHYPLTIHLGIPQTLVEVQQWSINHSEENWADPWAFRPERFLSSTEEARKMGNNLEALNAFSVGPRNCIGRK